MERSGDAYHRTASSLSLTAEGQVLVHSRISGGSPSLTIGRSGKKTSDNQRSPKAVCVVEMALVLVSLLASPGLSAKPRRAQEGYGKVLVSPPPAPPLSPLALAAVCLVKSRISPYTQRVGAL